MDMTRGIKRLGRGGGLRITWLIAAHWVALVVLPYLLFAAWAGALDDPDEWLTHRCWGKPHVFWLSLCNAGLAVLLVGEILQSTRHGATRFYLTGAGLFLGLLVAAQIALWKWVATLELLTGV